MGGQMLELGHAQVGDGDEARCCAEAACGPVVDARGRTDVVANQREVDDLLASMGF